MITPTHYMLLSAALFMIGVIGVMVRRNIIIIFMSIELILNAVNINLIAFSAQQQNAVGQVFAIFVIAVAAAEAAVTAYRRANMPGVFITVATGTSPNTALIVPVHS